MKKQLPLHEHAILLDELKRLEMRKQTFPQKIAVAQQSNLTLFLELYQEQIEVTGKISDIKLRLQE